MKLIPPFPLNTISQGFGGTAVNYNSLTGTIGHPGIDFAIPWGTPIPFATDAYCYSVMSKDNPNLMAYRAVFTIVDEADVSYEISYGHCSEIVAKPATWVKQGDIAADVGNTGDVFVGGVEVTAVQKLAGSHAGAHLHFQVRVLKKVVAGLPLDASKHYVNDGFGILTTNGYHYEVPNWNNGYNGCVDPAPFFATETAPTNDYDKLVAIANGMWATKPAQARMVLAIATLVKAFEGGDNSK